MRIVALAIFLFLLFVSLFFAVSIGSSPRSEPDVTLVLPDLLPERKSSDSSQSKRQPGDPILAWAGQRVVLTKDWRENSACPWGESGSLFLVRYDRTVGPGGLIDGVGLSNVDPNSQTVAVLVDKAGGPNTNCTSHIIYTAEDAGEIDVTMAVVDSTGSALSQPETQIVYYMKLEDISVGIDDKGDWVSSDGFDYSKVRVRGWIMTVQEDGTIVTETFDWEKTNQPFEQSDEPEYLCGGVLPPQHSAIVAALPSESRNERLRTTKKVIL